VSLRWGIPGQSMTERLRAVANYAVVRPVTARKQRFPPVCDWWLVASFTIIRIAGVGTTVFTVI